ncbi:MULTISPECIES: hypothetical protein [Streptomyces]|uniref:hypothetical protein n=1 Tax=Streptomyces TaxID=1883 RepID=UPI001317BDD5|nr:MULTISPECIES: hypothetical protein [Streptomyces]QGZ50803.1 hypothetical protein GPZ77_22650 [Streptomyces sp. QHH-9511]GGT82482.1 hypothetical protein GCM10010272_28810 [Streptomyces lateritius]
MSLQDDLAAVKRCLDDLVRTVGQLERSIAAERRAPAPPTSSRPENLVTIPDTPYDSGLWTDTDDEGLGARDRHAP